MTKPKAQTAAGKNRGKVVAANQPMDHKGQSALQSRHQAQRNQNESTIGPEADRPGLYGTSDPLDPHSRHVRNLEQGKRETTETPMGFETRPNLQDGFSRAQVIEKYAGDPGSRSTSTTPQSARSARSGAATSTAGSNATSTTQTGPEDPAEAARKTEEARANFRESSRRKLGGMTIRELFTVVGEDFSIEPGGPAGGIFISAPLAGSPQRRRFHGSSPEEAVAAMLEELQYGPRSLGTLQPQQTTTPAMRQQQEQEAKRGGDEARKQQRATRSTTRGKGSSRPKAGAKGKGKAGTRRAARSR